MLTNDFIIRGKYDLNNNIIKVLNKIEKTSCIDTLFLISNCS